MDATSATMDQAVDAPSSNFESGAQGTPLQQQEDCHLSDDETRCKEENGAAERSTCVDEAALSLLHIAKTEEGQHSGASAVGRCDEWPDRGGHVPLWIKWRGKWQAGVQCSLEDCPAATVKAMPTYGRKMYIVVFFPSTGSYVWTDWQLACSIAENPEPLACGSHESGRNSVSHSNLARQFMLKRITVSMLDISDCLPLQAVVECARHVSFWKDFAMEAAKATSYHELGVMLVKLKSMIIPEFLSMTWVCNRYDDWKHQCEVAGKASSMEKLIKELKNALLWDEVGKLWDQSGQMNMDSEWKSLKEFYHLKAMNEDPNIKMSHLRNAGHECNDEDHTGEMDVEHKAKQMKLESSSFVGSSPQFKRNRILVHTSKSIVGSTGIETSAGEARSQIHPVRCLAFSVRKGRQCNKYASDGSLYCFKHEPGNSGNERNKSTISTVNAKMDNANAEVDNANGAICIGETIYGRRCTHKAKEGSQFCLKHMMQGTSDGGSKRVAKESSLMRPSAADNDSGPIVQNLIDSFQGTFGRKRKSEPLNSCDVKDSRSSLYGFRSQQTSSTWTRCIGVCRRNGGQCSHRAKPGFSHCEKHLPIPREERSSPFKDSSTRITTSSSSSENRLRQLKCLVDEYIKVRLVEGGSEHVQQSQDLKKLKECIFAEASKDLKASEALYDHLTMELDCLKTELDEEDEPEAHKVLALQKMLKEETLTLKERVDEEAEVEAENDFNLKSKLDEEAKVEAIHAHTLEKKLEEVNNEPHKAPFPTIAGMPHGDGPSTVPIVEKSIEQDKANALAFKMNLGKEVEGEGKGTNALVKKLEEENEPCIILVPTSTTADSGGPSTFPIIDRTVEQHTPSFSLLKQGSSSSNGHPLRFKCKVCAQEFVQLTVLGQHWRACHKKEAQQYFRGYICHLCNLPFTNKKGLYRHRNIHHPGMSSQNKTPLIALCIICSEQFASFEHLWEHLVALHPAQLCAIWPVADQHATSSRPPLGVEIEESTKCMNCDQVLSSVAELHQHISSAHSHHVSLVASLPPLDSIQKPSETTAEYKYKCKICGLAFRLLPYLGRHHQAAHKPMQAVNVKNPETPSNQVSGINMLGTSSEKKKLQKLNVRRASTGHVKEEPITNEQCYSMPMRDPILVELDDFSGPKVVGLPTTKEILAAAAVACCKTKLSNILQHKYSVIPDQLAAKTAKLCSEANIPMHSYGEEYACPNGCRPLPVSSCKHLLDVSSIGASCVPQSTDFDMMENKDDNDIVAVTACSNSSGGLTCRMVLCNDLSFGKEALPIPCVIDKKALAPCSCSACSDNHSNGSGVLYPWSSFNYVTKRLLDPSLGLDTTCSQLSCSCQGPVCSPDRCEHVYLFDNDNIDAQDIYGKPIMGRFPYDSSGCIILEEGYLVYECNSLCICGKACQNRVLQKGVHVKLEVFKTKHKGWAVRSAQRIARGTFVCEYIGEVLDDCEANRRGERYDKDGCSYLYDIDAHIRIGSRRRTKPFVIDATKYGNVARFINHSCSPNLVNYQVLVESMDCQLAHIGLYATRDIEAGEELAYDYRYKLLPGKGCMCHCGAKDCRGRLY